MKRPPTTRLLLSACIALLALHVTYDTVGLGSRNADSLFAQWFQPVAFFGCGAATLSRALGMKRRAPWVLLGCALILYAGGNLYFNLATNEGHAPGFPS